MSVLTVAVTFHDDRAGRRRLAYADDLASRCGAELFLALPKSGAEICAESRRHVAAAGGAVADCPEISWATTPDSFAEMATGIHHCRSTDIAGHEGSWTDIAGALASRPKVIAVSVQQEKHFVGQTTVYPADEDAFSRHGDAVPRVLLPFGTGPDALRALAGLTTLLCPMTAKEVVLYHTTWRNPTVPGDNPEDHACPQARAMRLELENRIDALGWPYRTVIETASAVPAGVAGRALADLCSLICVARSPHIIKGSYVDELLFRSTVPLLVVADDRGSR